MPVRLEILRDNNGNKSTGYWRVIGHNSKIILLYILSEWFRNARINKGMATSPNLES
jgi:hypothetical protein